MARISDVVFALVPSHGTVEVREARMSGLRIFGVTVDEDAGDCVPFIFGRGAYAIFPNLSRRPVALPAIYRQITR